MKYLHRMIITGFMVPFLSLSAETAQTKDSDMKLVEQREEEIFLTSLDEELSLLDEEFEEFKEELYSLENDLQKGEKSVADTLLKTEIAQEEIAPFEESSDSQNDPILVFDTLSPEAEFNYPSEFLSNIAIDEPIKEVAIEAAKLPLIETSNIPIMETSSARKETAAEPKYFEATKTAAVDSFVLSPIVEKSQPVERSDKPLLAENFIKNTPVPSFIEPPVNDDQIAVDLKQAFTGSPIIYSLLLAMSIFAVGIWLYAILSLNQSARVSDPLMKNLQNKLNSNQFEEALSLCQESNTLFCKMISSGIHSRRHGLPMMIETMKAEGKRSSIAFWQKIGLINDIAIIAPMLGLLGTVLGMFYAFYDVNRSIESISTLFDGLGISVGTTVAGLVVAILALILHSTAKYRLVRALALVENEAQSVATLIDDRTSIYNR
jgi:biopolymer transport protein ExbB